MAAFMGASLCSLLKCSILDSLGSNYGGMILMEQLAHFILCYLSEFIDEIYHSILMFILMIGIRHARM